MFSCEFCKIFKSTSFYTTPPVAASWQVLKALVIEKKIFAIPPVFENSKCITNFGEKRTIFNSSSNPIVSLAPHLTQRFEKKHLILYFSIDNISNVSPCLDYATNHSKWFQKIVNKCYIFIRLPLAHVVLITKKVTNKFHFYQYNAKYSSAELYNVI